MRLCLAQRLEEPHIPLDNPALTAQGKEREGRISDVLARNNHLSEVERIAEVEAALLNRWSYKIDWRNYLDSPLIAHADAALSLGRIFDGVVGIKSAGTPYADIFRIMGNDVFFVDYSCHKKKMESPIIEPDSLEKLREKKNVLLVDIDIVTGKTIRDVRNYLNGKGVCIGGAYLGLSAWPGIEDDEDVNAINEDVVDFGNFWKICGSTRQLKTRDLYKMRIIPSGFRIFTSNGSIEDYYKESHEKGLRAARRIASYLLNHEKQNYQ